MKKNCGGHYVNGDMCGLETSPILCAQDFSETGYTYRTTRADAGVAVIEMRWVGRDDLVGTYRMIHARNKWILDGVSCAGWRGFNW